MHDIAVISCSSGPSLVKPILWLSQSLIQAYFLAHWRGLYMGTRLIVSLISSTCCVCHGFSFSANDLFARCVGHGDELLNSVSCAV
jgi:hypothetical protein